VWLPLARTWRVEPYANFREICATANRPLTDGTKRQLPVVDWYARSSAHAEVQSALVAKGDYG